MTTSAISLSASQQGEALIDLRSPLHLIIGFTAGIIGVEPHLAMLTFVGGRLIEQALRAGAHDAFFEREEGQSLGNEMTDLLLELGGLQLGEKLRARLTEEPGLEPEPEPAAGIGYYQNYYP